jgi:hypothetical protein
MVIITGKQSLVKRPNLNGKRFLKDPIRATTAIIEYEEKLQRLEATLLSVQVTHLASSSGDGLDQAIEFWASGKGIKVKRFKPLWVKNGVKDRRAGFDKLLEMTTAAEGAIIIGTPDSRCNTILREMKKAGKPWKIIQLEPMAHSSDPPF